MKPKISVIMSVHNNEKYLADSVESILKQTFSDFEFIIIEDASSDNSLSILKTFQKKDKRIKLVINEQNIGLTASLNKALEIAQGEYIARMDDDDISHPLRFAKQVEYLDSNKDIALLGTSGILIDSEGKLLEQIKTFSGFERILGEVFFRNVFIHSSMLIRKNVLKEVNGYDENFKKSQDYNLVFKILAKGCKLDNLTGTFVKYRTHSESISQSQQEEQGDYAVRAIKFGLNEILGMEVPLSSIIELRRFVYFQRQNDSIVNTFISLKLLRDINKNLIKRYNLSRNSLKTGSEVLDIAKIPDPIKFLIKHLTF